MTTSTIAREILIEETMNELHSCFDISTLEEINMSFDSIERGLEKASDSKLMEMVDWILGSLLALDWGQFSHWHKGSPKTAELCHY